MGQGAISTGRAGEYFAAYVLESYGVEAYRVDTQYSDLWCRVGDELRAVEVKTCTSPSKTGRSAQSYYCFNVKAKKHGWFCFVALDRELLLLYPVEQIGGMDFLRLTPSEFNAANQRRTIEQFLES